MSESSAFWNAVPASSVTNAVDVTMMLSFTNAPTGSALPIAPLYAFITGSSSEICPTEKPRTPSPFCAAIS